MSTLKHLHTVPKLPRRPALIAISLAFLVGAVACSGDPEGVSTNESPGQAGGSAGAAGNSSGGSTLGGFGGGVPGTGGSAPVQECAFVTQTTENRPRPSDIIIAVDQSGSMATETQWVQAQLNGFSSQIAQAGIDVRVVLIVEKPGGPVGEHPICVPPPLAGANCSDNPPLFTHVNQHVDSEDALVQIVRTYNQYEHMLRPEASKHLVVISDDRSEISASEFDGSIRNAGGSMFDDYVFHAIVCETACAIAADVGTQYMELVQMTGGVIGDLCQQDFQPVWDEVSRSVVETSPLACSWDIPAPPDGEELDPDLVNVVYTNGADTSQLQRVDREADCPGGEDGWYYDDKSAPTAIIACPELCAEMQSGGDQQIDIAFGCQTNQPLPR